MAPSSDVLPMVWTSRSVTESFLRAMEDHNREVGTRIRTLRFARDEMTQRELSDKIGVSEKTISRWENGRTKGMRDNIRKLAEALDVLPADILGEPPAPLGLGANGDVSQLDRIEAKLDAIMRALQLDEGAVGAEVLQKLRDERRRLQEPPPGTATADTAG